MRGFTVNAIIWGSLASVITSVSSQTLDAIPPTTTTTTVTMPTVADPRTTVTSPTPTTGIDVVVPTIVNCSTTWTSVTSDGVHVYGVAQNNSDSSGVVSPCIISVSPGPGPGSSFMQTELTRCNTQMCPAESSAMAMNDVTRIVAMAADKEKIVIYAELKSNLRAFLVKPLPDVNDANSKFSPFRYMTDPNHVDVSRYETVDNLHVVGNLMMYVANETTICTASLVGVLDGPAGNPSTISNIHHCKNVRRVIKKLVLVPGPRDGDGAGELVAVTGHGKSRSDTGPCIQFDISLVEYAPDNATNAIQLYNPSCITDVFVLPPESDTDAPIVVTEAILFGELNSLITDVKTGATINVIYPPSILEPMRVEQNRPLVPINETIINIFRRDNMTMLMLEHGLIGFHQTSVRSTLKPGDTIGRWYDVNHTFVDSVMVESSSTPKTWIVYGLQNNGIMSSWSSKDLS